MEMRERVVARDVPEGLEGALTHIGGVDISWANDTSGQGWGVLVVLGYPSLEVVYQDSISVHTDVQYASGFLGFRETPHFLKLWERLVGNSRAPVPGVVLVDGFGTLHPAGCGSACMLGIAIDTPTIGVGKSMNMGACSQSDKQIRSALVRSGQLQLPLMQGDQVVGTAVRKSLHHSRPVYVSVGHRVSLETAARVVSACLAHKIPEPIRQADLVSRDLVRRARSQTQSAHRPAS